MLAWWECFPGGKLPFALVLRITKRYATLASKKEASFIFEARLRLTFLVIHSYLGWESNPHGIATIGF